MNKCEKCGFLHYRTDPCRKPMKPGSSRGRASHENGGEIIDAEAKTGKYNRLVTSEEPLSVSVNGPAFESQPGANKGEAQKVERRSPKPKAAGSIPATFASAGSSSGRIAEFDSADVGSNPAPASKAKFDKVAYQREYMRKRRAEAKSNSTKES